MLDIQKKSVYNKVVTCTPCNKYKMKEGDLLVNLDKLKGKMREMGKTYEDGAKFLGITTTTFSKKMNGESKIYVDEANLLSEFLKLTAQEKIEIFLPRTCMSCKGEPTN